MYEAPSGYTGKILETEVLGECRIKARGYLKFNQSIEEVKENQPYDPHHPTGEAGSFHDAVAEAMGIEPDQLEMYTAVGSALDRFHGVDGFFEFNGIVITVDVTANEHKDSYKARVIVTEEDAGNGFKESARIIAAEFKRAKDLGWTGVV
ncbi:MAG: hypothetical protein KGI49_00310 [Patescibacteria group bacterium]|nr:hypothetical protein [Patescibacteria group bacterium]